MWVHHEAHPYKKMLGKLGEQLLNWGGELNGCCLPVTPLQCHSRLELLDTNFKTLLEF